MSANEPHKPSTVHSMWRRLLFLCLLLFLSVALLELLYRFQAVDCYRGELLQSTDPAAFSESGDRKTLLVMGDSFAAGPGTFVADLDGELNGNWRTINSAVSGSGVVQARIMAPGRFKKFRPSVFLYQIYVGNDLFDFRYPTAWGRVSYPRSLYWTISRSLRSLSWFNYKMGQVRAGARYPPPPPGGWKPPVYDQETDIFSPESFTLRDRIYATAEPSLVADSVLLSGRLGRIFPAYLDQMDRLLGECRPGTCQAVVLVIPHFSQLGPESAEKGRQIGFEGLEGMEFFALDYPFVARLEDHLKRSRPDVLLINPLEEFRQEEVQGRQLYFQNDSHLNPNGQGLLAKIVRGHLDGLERSTVAPELLP